MSTTDAMLAQILSRLESLQVNQLAQILSQLESLQVNQQIMQAKVRRICLGAHEGGR